MQSNMVEIPNMGIGVAESGCDKEVSKRVVSMDQDWEGEVATIVHILGNYKPK